jgi:predicted PurR-regulated permease PerM
MPDATPKKAGSGYLLNCASLVVIVAGLKLAGQVLVPLLIAVFMAIVCLPLVQRLQRQRVPRALAILLVLSGLISLLTGFGFVVGGSADELTQVLPGYRDRFQGVTATFSNWLHTHGIEVSPDALVTRFDKPILALISEGAKAVAAVVSNTLLVVLTTLFILFEAEGFPAKFRAAFHRPDSDLERFHRFARDMQTYLGVKTATSMATGLIIGLFVWALDIDFPLLLGLMAFLLNFIPTLGSIIAAIPAVMLAIISPGGGTVFLVIGGYAGVNVSIGNLLEPQLMGKELGLSPMVVFLSLVFWGWVWGPVGMLLSVPLTMVGKIFLAHTEGFSWVAVLLGDSVEERPKSLPPAAPPASPPGS